MAITLDAEDQATVEQGQLAQAALPQYFSAALLKQVTISRDFEAFLLLAPNALKTSAIQWIQKAVAIHQSNKLRDDLSTLALTQELANAQAQMAECAAQLQGFESFRANFQTSSEFAAVPEVQLFLTDLQGTIDELAVKSDRAYFDQTVTQLMQTFEGTSGITAGQIQELQSWTSVISIYLTG
jgi:hypothetical protein